MQQRVVVTSFNPADFLSTLSVVEARSRPQDDEILVRVTARPVNPADVFSIMGVYPGFAPKALPATPGLEGAGVIAAVNGTSTLSRSTGCCFPRRRHGRRELAGVCGGQGLELPPRARQCQ